MIKRFLGLAKVPVIQFLIWTLFAWLNLMNAVDGDEAFVPDELSALFCICAIGLMMLVLADFTFTRREDDQK